MTIPFFIQDHITHQYKEVPQEILAYCDDVTVDAQRDDLRYLDCVYMNMGMYGNKAEDLQEMRNRHYYRVYPVFE